MKYEPDGRVHLPGNGNLHLHFVLSLDNGLDVAELVAAASLRASARVLSSAHHTSLENNAVFIDDTDEHAIFVNVKTTYLSHRHKILVT